MKADKIKFIVALMLFVLPCLVSLVMQKEAWPFSHYPMFSTKHVNKKYAAIKVKIIAEKEERELTSYYDLFPLGAQCTVKLLLNTELAEARLFSPDQSQIAHLKKMSEYYKNQFQDQMQSKIQAVEIFFVGYDYSESWRNPEVRKKIIWKEEFR